ncbi:MAG: hypothetical protein ACPG05_05015 [Bdellovibrionales bacterium]
MPLLQTLQPAFEQASKILEAKLVNGQSVHFDKQVDNNNKLIGYSAGKEHSRTDQQAQFILLCLSTTLNNNQQDVIAVINALSDDYNDKTIHKITKTESSDSHLFKEVQSSTFHTKVKVIETNTSLTFNPTILSK